MAAVQRTAELQVAQHDLRTVRVQTHGDQLLLRYGFTFDGHERVPESVVVEGNEVRAFFLSSTVRDIITPRAHGFTIRRHWAVMQSGKVRISACIDVVRTVTGPRGRPQVRSFRYLAPGVAAGEAARAGPLSIRGERTAIPATLVVGTEGLGICLTARPEGPSDPVSVRLEHATDDNGELVRFVLDSPPTETLPWLGEERRDDPGDGSQPEAEGHGEIERVMVVHVTLGTPRDVYGSGLLEVLSAPSPAAPRKPSLREAARSLVATHYVERGGVAGVRVVPASDLLSAAAGAQLAVHLCRLHGEDPEMVERALRLGDTCLSAQHPSGLFYERYSLKLGAWVGLRGAPADRPDRPPLLSVEESSRVAAALLDLGEALRSLGRETSRYELAGRRMVDAFFDAKGAHRAPPSVVTADGASRAEEGLAALRFLHPLLRVMDRDSRERYRKAALATVTKWLTLTPGVLELPSSRPGREPDSRAALLLVEAALEAARRKIRIPDLEALVFVLLPWVTAGETEDPVAPGEALVDSFSRARWKPRPCQIAWLCATLATLTKGRTREVLARVASHALSAVPRHPMGTGHVRRVRWIAVDEKERRGAPRPHLETGPVDARDFVIELEACLGLEADGLW